MWQDFTMLSRLMISGTLQIYKEQWRKRKFTRAVILGINVGTSFLILLEAFHPGFFAYAESEYRNAFFYLYPMFLCLLVSTAPIALSPLLFVIYLGILRSGPVLLVAGFLILAYQIIFFLRTGHWKPFSVLKALSSFVDLSFLYDSSDWVGFKRLLLKAAHALPTSGTLSLFGVLCSVWAEISVRPTIEKRLDGLSIKT